MIILILSSSLIFGQNWMNRVGLEKSCQPSYFVNMKVTDRLSTSKVRVSQNSIGHSGVGFVELVQSKEKKLLPIVGKSFLDIFVKKVKTMDGYDYWIECESKKREK